jgi:hypothetical protein
MDSRVTALTRRADRPSLSPRSGSIWTGGFLVAAGIALGYLLAQGISTGPPPADTNSAEVVTSAPFEPPALVAPEPSAPAAAPQLPAEAALETLRTSHASLAYGRGLLMWQGNGDPIKILLASDVWAAAYDAAQSRIAVTLRGYAGEGQGLHVGYPGDLRFVTSGVTSFAWHPTDPSAIAWVQETRHGFALVEATVSDGLMMATQIAMVGKRIRLVAWGSWGFAVQDDHGLTTFTPSGAPIAHDDVQFVAAGSNGRLIVARPAGVPLSNDWAITQPDLSDQQSLERFGDLDAHPTAAAILPSSGRIVLVTNDNEAHIARIEILNADGTRQAAIRSEMIAESIAWSPDEARLAIGGHRYSSNQIRPVVLVVASDGTGEAIEVPSDYQARPLGIRE